MILYQISGISRMLNFRRAFKRRKFKCILAWGSPYNSCVLKHNKLYQYTKSRLKCSYYLFMFNLYNRGRKGVPISKIRNLKNDHVQKMFCIFSMTIMPYIYLMLDCRVS